MGWSAPLNYKSKYKEGIMKKAFIKRIISALLILVFIFSAVSCSQSEPEKEFKGGLEIISEKVEYSNEYVTEATERFSLIIDKIPNFQIILGMSKESAVTSFKEKILPKLAELCVYEEDVNEIFSYMENLSESEETVSLLSSLYSHLVYSLGSRKAGSLLYTAVNEILAGKILSAREKYENHGLSQHLEVIERCEALSLEIKSIGEEKFSELMLGGALISSTVRSTEKSEESALSLSSAELLYILDRQGASFLEIAASADDWKVVGRLLTELSPAVTLANNAAVSILYTLKKEAYFNSAIQIMPSVFNLYAALAHNLKAEGKFDLSADSKENEAALCSALLSSEKELKALYEAINTYAAIDSTELKNKVHTFYGEASDSFLLSHSPLTYEALVTELTRTAAGEENSMPLYDIMTNALCSASPHLTFILLG